MHGDDLAVVAPGVVEVRHGIYYPHNEPKYADEYCAEQGPEGRSKRSRLVTVEA